MDFFLEKLVPPIVGAIVGAFSGGMVAYLFTYRGQRENRMLDAYAELLGVLAESVDSVRSTLKHDNRSVDLSAAGVDEMRKLVSRVAAAGAKARLLERNSSRYALLQDVLLEFEELFSRFRTRTSVSGVQFLDAAGSIRERLPMLEQKQQALEVRLRSDFAVRPLADIGRALVEERPSDDARVLERKWQDKHLGE